MSAAETKRELIHTIHAFPLLFQADASHASDGGASSLKILVRYSFPRARSILRFSSYPRYDYPTVPRLS